MVIIKISPKYSKKLLKQPYFKGIMTGFLLGLALAMINIDIEIGLYLLILSLFIYGLQVWSDQNFI